MREGCVLVGEGYVTVQMFRCALEPMGTSLGMEETEQTSRRKRAKPPAALAATIHRITLIGKDLKDH